MKSIDSSFFYIHARTLLLLIACRCSWAKSLNGCQGWSEEIGIHCFLDFVFSAVQQLRLIYAVWRATRAMCFTMTMSLCFWVESNGKQKLHFHRPSEVCMLGSTAIASETLKNLVLPGGQLWEIWVRYSFHLFQHISTFFKKILTNRLYYWYIICIKYLYSIYLLWPWRM